MGFLRTPNVPEPTQFPVAIVEPSSSGSEDEQEEVAPRYEPRRRGQAGRRRMVLQALQDPSQVSCRTCKFGRRWARRIDNGIFLRNLIRQGEEPMEDIIEQEPSVFERLLCDEQAMRVWDAFISKPEDEQRALLTKNLAAAKVTATKDPMDKSKPSIGKKCFKRICPIVQDFLNCESMPKSTLLNLEPRIIEFFCSEPNGQYVTDPLHNNDRKVLHGLAQYLDLNSQSFNCEVSYDQRCTRVTNPKPTFSVPPVLLSEFLGIS